MALLATIACGDDGGGGGTEGSSTGGTGSSTEAGSTSTGPANTTSDGEASSGSTGPGEGSSTAAADGGSSTGGSTGAPSDCGAQADQETCEATMGCLWLGNMQGGMCLPDDPAVCPELDMMQCQQHPACDWSNQEGACMAMM